MTPFPYIGVLLELGDYVTHWPIFRWVGYAFSFAGLLLTLKWQWQAKRAPVAITYTCPYYCGFLGDQIACEVHSERSRVRRQAA